MRSGVYERVRCPSVCPIRLPQFAVAGLLLWARWAGDIYRLLQQHRANVGSAALSAYVSIAGHKDLFSHDIGPLFNGPAFSVTAS